MVAETATKSRRPPLTRQRVLQQAIELADGDGVAGLSMRKIAQSLGVQAMSLYNHVENKADILDGMVDIVIGEIPVPAADGDWRTAMARRAHAAHEMMMRHPWAAMLLMSRMNTGPSMLRYVDATLGCLRAGGFSFAQADHAWNTLDSYIYGFTLQALNFPIAPDDYAEVAEAHLPRIPADEYPHLHGLSQEVMGGRHDGKHALAFGLELLLDGLERQRGGLP